MTKEDIKKVLALCIDTFNDVHDSCDICEYSDYNNCQDYLCRDALAIINEQEKEIERLKANGYRSIMNAFENNRDKIVENIQTEIDDYKQSIKQAKIDVLNDVKKRIYDISPYNPLVTKDNVKYLIYELIKEVENDN